MSIESVMLSNHLSVVPFSSSPQSFPASGSFPMSRFFASGGQRMGASASILSMTVLISLLSKGCSRVFSNITVQKHQFFSTQPSLWFNSLTPHGMQHARLPCPSLSPRVSSNSCPLSQWCHSTISFSAAIFSACRQSFPEPGPFPVSQLFISGGQSIGASALAPVLSINIQDWSPLGLYL